MIACLSTKHGSNSDLGNFYRFLLLCKYYGLISLQRRKRHNSEVSTGRNKGKLMAHPSSPSPDENPRIAKLSIESKDASLGLQMITERFHSRIQLIHYQCLSVPKREKYHLMRVTLSANITERFRKSCSSKVPTKTFVN